MTLRLASFEDDCESDAETDSTARHQPSPLHTDEEATAAAQSSRDLRAFILVGLLLSCWGVLAGRLVYVQLLEQQQFARKAVRQRMLVEEIRARPGDIVDRNGRLLATSISTRSLFVDPSMLESPWETSLALSQALDMQADALFERLSQNANKRFLWIKRRLTDAEVERVRELELPSELWGFREEYLRQYPQGPLAAHILGLRDIDGVGQGGIEQQLDDELRGDDGKRVLERDAMGRVLFVRDEIEQPPANGRTVRLTIDAVMQLYVERELDRLMVEWKPDSACVVVMLPESGEILAMASRPGFDPNHPEATPENAWKNQAIAAQFEPGSTLKPFILAWALDHQAAQPDDRLYCENGAYRMGRRILHDHHSYGWLSLEDVLVKSSNIGMAKVGEKLTNDGLHEAVTTFGFGRMTGVELAGELTGLVRPLRKWNGYSTGSVPMGQELAVTPLQLITAHAALANGGRLVRPRLTIDEGNRLAQPTAVTRPCVSKSSAEWVVGQAMKSVVERGTGKSAQIENVSVFGKTGTAQKVDIATGRYSNSRHVCSFIAGAPAEQPEVLVLVMVDEPTEGGPHYGGTVAAPTSREILKLALGRVPDQSQLAKRPE